MTCTQTQNMISAYMDKELSGVEMQMVGQHLRQCPDCTKEHQQMLAMKRMMATLQVPAPSSDFELRLIQAVASGSQQVKSGNQPFWVKWFRLPMVMRPALALSSVCVAILGYNITHQASYVTAALNLNSGIEAPRQINLSRLQTEAEEIRQRWNGLAKAHQRWDLIRPGNNWHVTDVEADIQPVSFVSYSE